MNARQKCKKLKKELNKYKNLVYNTGRIATYSSIPINHYQSKVKISNIEIKEVYDTEEVADIIAKGKLEDEFIEFLLDRLPVKKEVQLNGDIIYTSDLYIGVE